MCTRSPTPLRRQLKTTGHSLHSLFRAFDRGGTLIDNYLQPRIPCEFFIGSTSAIKLGVADSVGVGSERYHAWTSGLHFARPAL